ncbi:MAG: sigma-70 family RNA polymerase sigma factor [Burkholderiales bacterium]|nr:MAG: sigma-70 family RNA polymerase sigma factor [Burkholderiales bacterium]
MIPYLRAFAGSLAGRNDGDDLAQDALARAWKARSAYEPGTNLKAWVFTILRNQFLSDKRRSWRNQPLDPQVAENTLVASDDASCSEELLDLRNALQLLPDEQRETLILVSAAGLGYLEVAKICGCAEGTVKSRVHRARHALADILATQSKSHRLRSSVCASEAFSDIMREAANVQRQLEAA